jgi:hypothetical protein
MYTGLVKQGTLAHVKGGRLSLKGSRDEDNASGPTQITDVGPQAGISIQGFTLEIQEGCEQDCIVH